MQLHFGICTLPVTSHVWRMFSVILLTGFVAADGNNLCEDDQSHLILVCISLSGLLFIRDSRILWSQFFMISITTVCQWNSANISHFPTSHTRSHPLTINTSESSINYSFIHLWNIMPYLIQFSNFLILGYSTQLYVDTSYFCVLVFFIILLYTSICFCISVFCIVVSFSFCCCVLLVICGAFHITAVLD